MSLPLRGLRVLDLTHGAAEGCGRYLADLGADVVLVEPPGGTIGRADPITFGLRNANKRGVVFDPADPADMDRLLALAGEADIVLESLPRALATSTGITPEAVLAAHPTLVVVSITDFGRTGPYADYVATDAVLAAMGGVLSRSGLPGRPPLLPPAGIVAQTAAVHAAWAALVAYAKRLRTGEGELVDLSAFEAVVHGFDPGFGTQGSAAAGRKESFPRDRPDAAHVLPGVPVRRRTRPHRAARPAAVARDVRLAGAAGGVRRPEVRPHRRPLRGLGPAAPADRRALPVLLPRRSRGRGHASRHPDRRRAQPARGSDRRSLRRLRRPGRRRDPRRPHCPGAGRVPLDRRRARRAAPPRPPHRGARRRALPRPGRPTIGDVIRSGWGRPARRAAGAGSRGHRLRRGAHPAVRRPRRRRHQDRELGVPGRAPPDPQELRDERLVRVGRLGTSAASAWICAARRAARSCATWCAAPTS